MYHDLAHEVRIEWDEDGAHLIIVGDALDVNYRLSDPEQVYDAIKAAIGPWLQERDEALAEYRQYVDTGTGPAADYFACQEPEQEWIRDVALGAMAVGESLEAAAAALASIDLSRKMEKER